MRRSPPRRAVAEGSSVTSSGWTAKSPPQTDQDVGAEGREAANLRIAFVQEVCTRRMRSRPWHPVVLLEYAVGATRSTRVEPLL